MIHQMKTVHHHESDGNMSGQERLVQEKFGNDQVPSKLCPFLRKLTSYKFRVGCQIFRESERPFGRRNDRLVIRATVWS
jgi:hypothetical protein